MVDSESNQFDINDFLLLKLISGEELFVSDMFEPGDILEESSKLVIVKDPVKVSFREAEEGKFYIAFAPWMITSSEEFFPIQKTSIISYAPIKKSYADYYLRYLIGLHELLAKHEGDEESTDSPKLDSDLEFLKRMKTTNPRKKK